MKKRATLRDVARHASVSEATVSRVLNAPAVVSQTTRNRVEASIEALQFRRSAAARAINSGRSYIVGALVPTLDNSIFSRFLVGLETQLDTFGLSLIVASTEHDDATEVVKAQKMIDIGAEGLVVSGVAHSDAFHALINRAALPVVAVSQYDPASSLPTVGYDNGEAVRIALGHLHGLGHRNIAVLHGPAHNNDRTRARIRALRETPGCAECDLYESDISIAAGRALAAQALAAKRGYTAMLCFSDVLAAGVLLELQHQGVSVPQGMSVMGIENLPSSAHTLPPLTTVRLQVTEMGVQAANALGHWVDAGATPDHKYLKSNLIVRETTGYAGIKNA